MQSSWFTPSRTPRFYFTTSQNGWTSNDVCLTWLREIFIPLTACDAGIPRLLLVDNHGSHITVDFMRICFENSIYLFYLIPHSSHVLQPLDLSCFSVVKSRYRRDVADLASLSDSAPIKKNHFLEIYDGARTEGLKRPIIRAGWKGSGISPWDPRKVIRSSKVKEQAVQ